jgi:hypothetical protein
VGDVPHTLFLAAGSDDAFSSVLVDIPAMKPGPDLRPFDSADRAARPRRVRPNTWAAGCPVSRGTGEPSLALELASSEVMIAVR